MKDFREWQDTEQEKYTNVCGKYSTAMLLHLIYALEERIEKLEKV